MKKKTVYIYPDRTYSIHADSNPYREDLAHGMNKIGIILIRSKTAWLGVIDLFLYLIKMDFIVFNWIEEVANRTLGYIQTLAFFVLIPILKVFKIKIVWTVHNKVSHSKKNIWISKIVKKVLLKKSDLIICHVKDGLNDFDVPDFKKSFFPHPFKINHRLENELVYEYDILMWGKIQPYKGILEFLSYLEDYGFNKRFKILIQGDCGNQEYLKKLKKFESENIKITDKYISTSELSVLMQKSKAIVFTHKGESVMSSGALIESLSHFKTVIGPSIGNFKDFKDEGILLTYDSFDQLMDILDGLFSGEIPPINYEITKMFIDRYSWESYARFIVNKLYYQ